MGEIIDLESYRRRLKRKGVRSRGGGNRRNPERAAPRNDVTGPKGKPRFGESGKAGPAGPAGKARIEKVESSDPTSE